MDAGVIIAIVTCIEGVTVAIIGGLFGYFTKKAEKKAEQNRTEDLAYREERKEHDKDVIAFNAQLLDLTFASANGVEVLLQAAHGDKLNGNVDKALQSLQRAKDECNHSVNERIAKGMV